MAESSKNEQAKLRAKQAEALQADITETAKKFSSIVEYLDGLTAAEIGDVLAGKEVKSALNKLGLQLKVEGESAVKKTRKAGKRTRRSKVSDEDIIKYFKTEHSVGEVRKDLGQTVPKRLEGLLRAGKLILRKDGLKKFYKAK